MSNCKKCGCEDKFLTPAPCPDPQGCPEPEPCSELFDAQCVQYTGPNIVCGEETIIPTNTDLATALTSITELVCDTPSSSGHYIGEEFGGGVIFHLYKDALGTEHGLICSIVNQSTSSQYSNISSLIGTTTSWDGQSNTTAMANQSGAVSGAWKDCQDYTYGGFSDWYLPALDELKLLFSNRYNTNKTLSTITGAEPVTYRPFCECIYITSTEYNNTGAFGINMETETVSANSKSIAFSYVRAIRQF